MSDDNKLPLPDLENSDIAPADANALAPDPGAASRGAEDLEAVFDVPVKVSAVLGRARMEVAICSSSAPVRCSSSTAKSARRSIST